MNAVEIEEAVSALADQPFDAKSFPFAFLQAFGNKETTIRRLKSGSTNQSDLPGGILQRNNIHIQVCPEGEVSAALYALRESPATTKQKAKLILATDGKTFEAENLEDGETVACAYERFSDYFGFFLPLAGITTVKQIRENAFDIKATGRLNKLYVELLKENPGWDTAARRQDLNHFMARLIFCFFAEDTHIFLEGLFTATVDQMSARDSSNTHEVLSELFRAMNTKPSDRAAANIRSWADAFPYVNGGLFSGSVDVPRFSRIARSYLLHVGGLNWRKINPDIFGSMIQAVADDEERGSLGMHYTSVPNILKVLNPLFLDDLRARLEEAGDNARKLLNLRERISRIRVFDPACGSGNFLVIAYKEMRAIESEINRRRGEADRRSGIPLTNFRGIEIRHFSCEIARLALIIAEYQCDVLYRGQKLALLEFLPLEAANWITCGNALRLDWLSICPPVGTGVKNRADDLFETPLEQAEINFENLGGETYICGNPPFTGAREQSKSQKNDLRQAMLSFSGVNSLDYVCGWIWKAVQYSKNIDAASAAFVATNSLCQGQSIPLFWDVIIDQAELFFAHRTFKWQNNATNNAAVHCVIVGLTQSGRVQKLIFDGDTSARVANISPYLTNNRNVIVQKRISAIDGRPELVSGNQAIEGGHLILERSEMERIAAKYPDSIQFFRPLYGADDFIRNTPRYCIWVREDELQIASQIPEFQRRFDLVREYRCGAGQVASSLVHIPHRFRYVHEASKSMLIVPRTTTERREYLPIGVLLYPAIVTDAVQVFYDSEIYVLSILSSKLHMSWIKAVAGRLKSDPRYSNTLVYNTFPIPILTETNKAELTRCAEDILMARESHFPATMADLYDPETMPANLRAAHEWNDETLERIYIGRRFKNDTERLEKLFGLYTKMTAVQVAPKKTTRKTKASKV